MDPDSRKKIKFSALFFFGLGVLNIVLSLATKEAIYLGIFFALIYVGIGLFTLYIATSN